MSGGRPIGASEMTPSPLPLWERVAEGRERGALDLDLDLVLTSLQEQIKSQIKRQKSKVKNQNFTAYTPSNYSSPVSIPHGPWSMVHGLLWSMVYYGLIQLLPL